MDWRLILLFLAASLFYQSNALRCYVCSHSKSWEHCNKYRTIHTCPSKANQKSVCYKLTKHRNFLNNTRDYTFATGCLYSQYCKVSYMCNSKESCDLHCCNTNLCNSGNYNGKIHKLFAVTGIVVSFLVRILIL